MGDDEAAALGWAPLAPASQSANIGWTASKTEADTDSGGKEKQTHSPLPTAALKSQVEKTHKFVRRKGVKRRKSSARTEKTESSLKRKRPPNEGYNDIEEQDHHTFNLCQQADIEDIVSSAWNESDCKLTLTAKRKTTVYVVGKFWLNLSKGTASVFGHEISATTEPLFVFSPPWEFAIDICFHSEGAIAVLKSARTEVSGEKTFTLASRACSDFSLVQLPTSWHDATATLQQNMLSPTGDNGPKGCVPLDQLEPYKTRVLVCGAKGAGKSTCVRYTLNRLLGVTSRVAVLDCDVGQPEFSPPGLLTLTIVDEPLLSPPHAHMLIQEEHECACFFGHNSVKANPRLFLNTIRQLVRRYSAVVSERYGGDETKLPLLVNTNGWVKGLGFELLSTISDLVHPTHVFQLGKGVSLEETVPSTTKVHRLDACGLLADSKGLNPATKRALRMVRYFASPRDTDFVVCQGGLRDENCIVGNKMTSLRPYVVSLRDIKLRTVMDFDLRSQRNTLDALEGAVVALCDGSDSSSTTVPCIGLGLVRSIDRSRGLVYLLTPIGQKALQDVDEIVLGEADNPTCLHSSGWNGTSFPFLNWDGSSSSLGGSEMKSRHTIRRAAHVSATRIV